MSPILTYVQYLLTLKFWIFIILILIIRPLIKIWLLRKRMPPGPTPLPLVGNLLSFRGAKVGSHEITFELSKKYGDPMTIFFFNSPAIILTNYELAKRVLQETNYSSRPDSVIFNLLCKDSQNIGFAPYNQLLQFHRKLIDADKLEYRVMESVDYTVELMLKEPEKVQALFYMRHIVFNVLASIAFGKTYKAEDQEFIKLMELNDRMNQEFVDSLVLDSLPFAKYLPLKLIPMVRSAAKTVEEFNCIRTREVQEHKKTYVSGQIRDFTDAMLNEQDLLRKEGQGQADQLTDQHISLILFDLFFAGTDTSSSSLTWFVLFMVMHPKIQEECYQAIIENVGDRMPRTSDRANLPLIEACILETLRLRPAGPLGLPHTPVCDTKIGDYFIPKGTVTFANIYAMHIDPQHWASPLEFDPRLHFMDKDGQLKKPGAYAPFGFGRRSCIGEQLAKNDLFLVVVCLLQKIRLEKLEGVTYNLDYDLRQDFAFTPLPFFMRILKRK